MREQNNKEDINGRGTSLSDLPDNVLSHIVSFLPTKEAVRTCILSKRWQCLWTSIPKLNFLQGHEEPMDFVNIVERALQLRGSFNITNFSVECKMNTFSHAWISSIVTFNIQHFELKLEGSEQPLILPLSFVNCETLTDFCLHMSGLLEFPSSGCFSNLKKLELRHVTFSSEHSTQQLFSSCLVLENLQLIYCDWRHIKTVSVASPRLKDFKMMEIGKKSVDGYEFVIVGGGLKSFDYEGGFYFNYNILNSELLEEVCIKYYSPKNPLRFIAFLRCISKNIRHLVLDNASDLFDIPELAIQIPMFTAVEFLGLDYKSPDVSNVGLLKMLQNCPRLECLIFREGIKKPSNPIEDGILDPVPPCFLNHLQCIGIHLSHGDMEELMGLMILLRNAVVLQVMAIGFDELVNEDIRNKFWMGLMKLPRGSKDCCFYTSNGAGHWEKKAIID